MKLTKPRSPGELPWPEENQVLLVYARVDDLSQAAVDHEGLSTEECRLAAQFTHAQARRRYVAARRFVRRTLGEWLGQEPAQIMFRTGPHGKPALASDSPAGAHFNLSHKGNWLLLALSNGRPVGVDLEEIVAHRNCRGIARRFLHPAEIQILGELGEPELAGSFTRLWTGKEALLKLCGDGLQGGLHSFSLAEWLRGRAMCCQVTQPRLALLQALPAPTGMLAAVALDGGDPRNLSTVSLSMLT